MGQHGRGDYGGREMRVMKDAELRAYKEAVGADEYKKEYVKLYVMTKQKIKTPTH